MADKWVQEERRPDASGALGAPQPPLLYSTDGGN